MDGLLAQILDRSGQGKSEAARRTGMSRSQLDRYLKGERSPTLDLAWGVAAAAGLEVSVELRPSRTKALAVMDDLALFREQLFPSISKPEPPDLRSVWSGERKLTDA
ncbi:MAG: helix-turn-helix transcriptional regulator [Nocardioidaceae bacterium]